MKGREKKKLNNACSELMFSRFQFAVVFFFCIAFRDAFVLLSLVVRCFLCYSSYRSLNPHTHIFFLPFVFFLPFLSLLLPSQPLRN